MNRLELWGGVECSVNRVGDGYFDQLARTGHAARIEDLDRFHRLGLRTLRYPILWERVAPRGLASADWTWADQRLTRLRELGMRPIVGLVHHGSGPAATDLLQDSFVDGVAAFAGAVAHRYPWIDAYTPINEPLTTARFSALYGHWYPHARDNRSFATALVNQVRAIRAAMRAIRAENPGARLVQTEDICTVSGTERVREQVDFENARRWLTFDLLSGRVSRDHPLRAFLCQSDVAAAHLDDLERAPCPPDIIGLNYYLTSDRFLDHRLRDAGSGTRRMEYGDVESVRVAGVGLAGHLGHLRAAYERYRIPVALTEVHAACSPEEQVRWFAEAWRAAQAARAAGVHVVAVTTWSLLGAFDWDSLVTVDRGRYESGVFDLRSSPPRATALSKVLRAVSDTGDIPDLAVLDGPGWWRRHSRSTNGVDGSDASGETSASRPRRLMIIGRTGTLGQALARACTARGIAHVLTDRAAVDIADPVAVTRAITRFRPWAVVNAAGYVDVDRAELDAERCFRENAHGPAVLADACAAAGIRFVTYSSDLVFDGADRNQPYLESDACAPLNTYGSSKRAAEVGVLSRAPDALVIRTSAFFGPVDRYNFITRTLDRLRAGVACDVAGDITITATYVPDLANASLDLLIDDVQGIWHLANRGAVTWADLTREAAARAALPTWLINAVPASSLGWRARRPAYSALASSRGTIMRSLDHALDAYSTDVRDLSPVQSSCA
jgi:dTDP-4-dehydrorhamnose reductase